MEKGESMSQDVIEIIKRMNLKEINIQLALQCAPVIKGLKQSNLLIVNRKDAAYIMRSLRKTSLSTYVLNANEEKVTLFLYRRQELIRYLQREKVKKLLHTLGYETQQLDVILPMIREKYEKYLSSGMFFPHEMGLILGYPAEDVHGFVVNEGKYYLYSGYWKVYQDAEGKKCMFDRFDRAKEELIRLAYHGISFLDLIINEKVSLLQVAG